MDPFPLLKELPQLTHLKRNTLILLATHGVIFAEFKVQFPSSESFWSN